jgi:GntR family transcriptional regulator
MLRCIVHATIPRYLRVYGSLKAQVEAGDFKQGDFLPAEPELQKLFNVSRTTVRRAVELLAQEGFVSIQQGKGTEVLDFKATQRLQYVSSFSETLRDKGFTVRFRDLVVDIVPAPRRVAADLKVAPDTRLVRVRRVTVASGKPVAIVLNYLLPEAVPGIEKRIGGMRSLYAFLESEYNLRLEAATDWISATAADAEQASRLEVPVSSPLLVVRRVTYSRGKPKDRPPRAE